MYNKPIGLKIHAIRRSTIKPSAPRIAVRAYKERPELKKITKTEIKAIKAIETKSKGIIEMIWDGICNFFHFLADVFKKFGRVSEPEPQFQIQFPIQACERIAAHIFNYEEEYEFLMAPAYEC